MDYPSHWRMAYLAAFFAHLAVWLFMSLAMPHLLRSIPEPPLEQEIEWTDMAAFQGELPAGGQDKGEAFDIPAQEMAELPEAKPAVEEVITPEDSPELVTDEEPVVAATEKEAMEKLRKAEKEGRDTKTIILSGGGGGSGSGAIMAENARLLKSFYPAPGTVSFGGRVSVSARIGVDGRVKSTKIKITSGRPLVDAVAMSAARHWVYKPATDRHGKPMECDAIIIIPFERLKE